MGRITMYIATVACSNELTQTNGIAMISYTATTEGKTKLNIFPEVWERAVASFPVRVTRMAVVQACDPSKSPHLLDFVRFRVAKVLEFNSGMVPEQFHGNSEAETIANLERGGISRNVIPSELGGNLNAQEELAKWISARLAIEDIMRADSQDVSRVPLELAAYTTKSAGSKRKRSPHEGDESCSDGPSRGALYSRRHYHRRKLAITSLQEQVKFWENRNKVDRKELNRLQQLLEQAQSMERILLFWYPGPGSPAHPAQARPSFP